MRVFRMYVNVSGEVFGAIAEIVGASFHCSEKGAEAVAKCCSSCWRSLKERTHTSIDWGQKEDKAAKQSP